MLSNHPDPRDLSASDTADADALAAIDLLDRLPASDDAGSDDWLQQTSILAIVELAEQVKVTQEEERRLAPSLATQLERHPEIRARMLIDNHRDFQTWGLAEELIDRSMRAIFDNDPPRAVRIARLAVAVATKMDAVLYSESLAADLKARTWGNLGNGYRCAGQVQAARAAFERCWELLLDGTGDPLEQGRLLSYEASLATETGDFQTAIELLHRASAIYRQIGEDHLLARVLVKLSIPLAMSEPETAIEVAIQAESLLEPDRDPSLYIMARHNRIQSLLNSDRPEQAAMLLEASRKHYRAVPETRWAELHVAWSEARLSFALGSLDEAEAGLEVVLEESLERGRQLDGALAALQLAACQLTMGKTGEAAELAGAMAHHLQEWGAHHRAREAWGLLQQALERERATVEMVDAVANFLRRYWRNPNAPFTGAIERELGHIQRQ